MHVHDQALRCVVYVRLFNLTRRLLEIGVCVCKKLDGLVFAEMQNEAMAHMLGFGRFAPVQILAMGSPITSGNPSIDYFVSCARSEVR